MTIHPIEGDLPISGGVRSYPTFRNHAGGTSTIAVTNVNKMGAGAPTAAASANRYIRFGLRNTGGSQIASVQINPGQWGHNMIFRRSNNSANIPSGRYALNGRSEKFSGTYLHPHRYFKGSLKLT
ncbi:hypothetical protein [Agrococcus casei]|nr:hypothetical protein [Agrococcus casei]